MQAPWRKHTTTQRRYPRLYPLSFSSRVSGASISLEEWTRIFPTKVKAKHCPLHAVCIKSDSEFLVKGVIEWLPKRKGNG